MSFYSSITLFPLPVQKEVIDNLKTYRYLSNNYIPFKGIGDVMQSGHLMSILRNVAGNIVLFIPLGFLTPLLFKKVSTFGRVVVVGLCCSVAVEWLQLSLSSVLGPYKVTDIDDVILNTLGTMVGFVSLRLAMAAVSNLKVKPQSSRY